MYLKIEENLEYEARDNGPGCVNGLNVSEDDCLWVAEFLGFKPLGLNNNSWGHAPPGCHVGHGKLNASNWNLVYFNYNVTGTLDRKIYKTENVKLL